MRTINLTIRNLLPAIMISTAIAAEPAKPDESLVRALRETELPSMNFADITLGEACDFMQFRLRELGREHREYPVEAKDGKVSIRKVTGLSVEGLPFGVALAYLAEFTGTTLTIDGGTIRYSMPGDGKAAAFTPADFANPEAMPHSDPAKVRLAPIEFRDTGFADAVSHIKNNWRQAAGPGREGSINIICLTGPEKVSRVRNLTLENKTAREVLEELAKTTGTRVVFAAHAVEFRPEEKEERSK